MEGGRVTKALRQCSRNWPFIQASADPLAVTKNIGPRHGGRGRIYSCERVDWIGFHDQTCLNFSLEPFQLHLLRIELAIARSTKATPCIRNGSTFHFAKRDSVPDVTRNRTKMAAKKTSPTISLR